MRDKTVRLDLVLKTVHDYWKAELDADRENELAILRNNRRICKALEALPTSVCVDSFRVCVDDEKGGQHGDVLQG